MKFIINLAIVLLVGLVAARQRQAGVKSLLATGAAAKDNDGSADVVLVSKGGDKGCSLDDDRDYRGSGGSCKIRQEPPSSCNLESDSPQGTVSVSIGTSESYNCNDSAFTTFNFPSIDDYQRSGLAESMDDDYNRCNRRQQN